MLLNNLLFLFFIHMKLEFLAQFPASNEKYFYLCDWFSIGGSYIYIWTIYQKSTQRIWWNTTKYQDRKEWITPMKPPTLLKYCGSILIKIENKQHAHILFFYQNRMLSTVKNLGCAWPRTKTRMFLLTPGGGHRRFSRAKKSLRPLDVKIICILL